VREAPGRTADRADRRVIALIAGKGRRGIVARTNTAGGAGRITVYVPPELALPLRAYCFANDRTISDVAGEMLVKAFERLAST
jgi:hypothetical protein